MRNLKPARGMFAMALVALFAVGCGDDDDNGMMGPNGPTADDSPIINSTVTQLDRSGLPAINTAFVSESADKNTFNQSVPANDAQFIDLAAGVLMMRYGLNAMNANTLADLVLPDVQPLGDLSGALFNGRRLTDDVIDAELGVLFGDMGLSDLAPQLGLASDNVDSNDVPFLGTFPYLGTPNT